MSGHIFRRVQRGPLAAALMLFGGMIAGAVAPASASVNRDVWNYYNIQPAPRSDAMLRQVVMDVHNRERQSLGVPELAVIGDGDERFVFVLDGRTAKRTKVETGIRQNGLVEILGGVKAGQQIVTEGVVKLTDGAPVRLAGDKKGDDDKGGKPAKAAG